MHTITARLARAWAMAAALLVGCSDDDGSAAQGAAGAAGQGGGGAGSGKVDFGGGLISHSMNKLAASKLGRTAELTGVSASVLDQSALTLDGSAAALASTPVDTGNTMPPIPFLMPGVDLSAVSGGLVTRLSDTRPSDLLWMTTETGFGTAAQVAALKGATSTNAARSFAVSFDAVEAVVGPMAQLSKEQLVERGFVFGLVYGGASADGSGAPVVGATVAPSDASFTVVYPNNNFSGAAASTTNQGAFLAIPSEVGATKTVTFTVTPPSGQAYRWDPTQQALARPGVIHFILLYPQG